MAAPALLSIHDAYVRFDKKPLFEELTFHIHQSDKICLVGKNGAGKSTLMELIVGTRELDAGRRWAAPGVTIGYLKQDITPNPSQKVFDYVMSALPKEKQTEEYSYQVHMMLEPLDLHENDLMGSLSGGQLRRAALAHALIEEPDILLLDEPTNHLDLQGIQWLESYLNAYRGTLLCISHDKAFLSAITNRIFWLDRSSIRVCQKGFKHFDEWTDMLIEQEARELAKREKLLAQEVEWASRGVKARRKRNMRRVSEMQKEREALKSDKSAFRNVISKVELAPLTASEASRLLIECFNVSKEFVDPHHEDRTKTILNRFFCRIKKGDRIGIIGNNGSGKTTFLKLITGQLTPDTGTIKLAKNAEISYFDQKREDLNPKETLWRTLCPDGGDHVQVGGKPKHVCGYLKTFLFDPKDARNQVATLSGGQKNRLMLAKVLADPGNLLILDEPTNDLDMDTLQMLEDILATYDGTLFVVSHDRDFLDKTVSQIFAFEGDGKIVHSIGGYSDYLTESKRLSAKEAKIKLNGITPTANSDSEQTNITADSTSPFRRNGSSVEKSPKKLSFKLQHELKTLPEKIASLEKEVSNLSALMSDPDLYMKKPDLFDQAMRRLAEAQKELESSETRWLELEEQRNESA